MVQQLYNLVQSFSDQSTTTSPGMKTSLLLLLSLASCKANPLVDHHLGSGFTITFEDGGEVQDLEKTVNRQVKEHQKDEEEEKLIQKTESLQNLNEMIKDWVEEHHKDEKEEEQTQTTEKTLEDNKMSDEQLQKIEDEYFDSVLDLIEGENYEETQKPEVKNKAEMAKMELCYTVWHCGNAPSCVCIRGT